MPTRRHTQQNDSASLCLGLYNFAKSPNLETLVISLRNITGYSRTSNVPSQRHTSALISMSNFVWKPGHHLPHYSRKRAVISAGEQSSLTHPNCDFLGRNRCEPSGVHDHDLNAPKGTTFASAIICGPADGSGPGQQVRCHA